jgi:hypothetical protein
MLPARTFNSGLEAMIREYNPMQPKFSQKNPNLLLLAGLKETKHGEEKAAGWRSVACTISLSSCRRVFLEGETRFLLQSIKAGVGVDAKGLD